MRYHFIDIPTEMRTAWLKPEVDLPIPLHITSEWMSLTDNSHRKKVREGSACSFYLLKNTPVAEGGMKLGDF